MIKKTITYLFILLVLYSCKTGQSSIINTVSEDNKLKAERLFFNGQKAKIKEDFQEAVKAFEQSVKLYPKLDAAYFELAQIKLEQKDYKSSLYNVEQAVKYSPENRWYREFYGELLSFNANFDKAADVFKKLKTDYPFNSDYYFNEAYFYQKRNKYKEALKVYNDLEEKIGIQESISNEKYKVYLKESNFKAAENELEKLHLTYPNNLKFLNKFASFEYKNERFEKAVQLYKKVLDIDSNNAVALISLADYYHKEGNDKLYQEYSKKVFLNKAINIDTKIGVIYSYIQKFEKDSTALKGAFEYADLLVQTHPEEAKAWAIYGDLYNLKEQPKKALEKYLKSLGLQQNIFTVWQQVFFIQSDEKNYKDLASQTETALEFFPNQALVYFFNGLAHQELKNPEKALDSYSQGVKMSTQNPNLQSQFYSNMAEIYNKKKNYLDSDKFFEKALFINPNNQFVLNNYSYYLSLRAEKLERAKEMSLKSLELSPDNPTYLDTYAWILYKNKEYSKALENQKKAIKLSEKPSATLFEHLGDILYKLNKKEEAISNWKTAKEKGNDSETLDQKIADEYFEK